MSIMPAINQLIFLIHPGCYEAVDEETARANNWTLFVDWQRQVKQRWLDDMADASPGTLLAQLYGPRSLFDAAVTRLGEERAVYLSAEFRGNDFMRQYYDDLLNVFHAHLRDHRLDFDPATANAELWGESLEGCVPGQTQRRYFRFMISALGDVCDLLVDHDLGLGAHGTPSWSTDVQAAAHHEAGLYRLELRIPFADLGPAPRRGDRWNANLYRFVPDCAAWNPTYGGFHSPLRFGTLVFD